METVIIVRRNKGQLYLDRQVSRAFDEPRSRVQARTAQVS